MRARAKDGMIPLACQPTDQQMNIRQLQMYVDVLQTDALQLKLSKIGMRTLAVENNSADHGGRHPPKAKTSTEGRACLPAPTARHWMHHAL
jgi:hypothetical protein